MRSWGVPWLIALAILFAPTLARAEDVAQKVKEINGYLQDLKGKLDPAPTASEVRSAIELAKKIKTAAEKLKGMKPTGDAKKMADTYPAIADRFKPAADELLTMMSKVEGVGELAKKCKDAEAKRTALIKSLVDEDDPSKDPTPGFKDSVEAAKKNVEDALEDARARAAELEKLKQGVLVFKDSDGGWQWAKERLHKRAERIDTDYENALKGAVSACASLSQGLAAPAVVAALPALKDSWTRALARRTCGGNALTTVKKTVVLKDLDTGSDVGSSDRVKARACGCVTDDGGHAVGKKIGGSGHFSDGNLFPQDPKTNRGQLMQYEKDLVKMLREYGRLEVTVTFSYDAHSPTRPTKLVYEIKAEAPDDRKDLSDVTTSKSFDNPLPDKWESADVCPGVKP